MKYIFFISLLFLISCKEEKVTPSMLCMSIDVGLNISIKNGQGKDLLSSDTESYFPFEPMKLYYDINGRTQEVYNPLMDSPRNISLITETSPHRLRVFTSPSKEGLTSDEDSIQRGESIAYLQLNEQITDTIRTQWEASECYFVNRKLWYNGVLYDPIPEVIEIVK